MHSVVNFCSELAAQRFLHSQPVAPQPFCLELLGLVDGRMLGEPGRDPHRCPHQLLFEVRSPDLGMQLANWTFYMFYVFKPGHQSLNNSFMLDAIPEHPRTHQIS